MNKHIKRFVRRSRTRAFWKKFISIISCIVVFCTTYALVLPAITLEKTAICGIEEHEHTEECFEERLVCGLEEKEGHEHTEQCYKVEKHLICKEKEHIHDEGCYDAEGNLTCALEEHSHSDECYEEDRVLVCALEETEGHAHTADCYQNVLVCEKKVHIHSTDCYLPDADPIEFAEVLTNKTSVWYLRPDAGEYEWKKITDGTILGADDLVRLYFAYKIPAGRLDDHNAVTGFPMPEGIRLTDEQIGEINAGSGGAGAQAIAGTRTPDHKPGGDEYVSAYFRIGDSGRDVEITFDAYTIEQNRRQYNEKGKLTGKGKEVKGFFSIDITPDQIDFEEISRDTRTETFETDEGTVDRTIEETVYEADIILVQENSVLGIEEIAGRVRLAREEILSEELYREEEETEADSAEEPVYETLEEEPEDEEVFDSTEEFDVEDANGEYAQNDSEGDYDEVIVQASEGETAEEDTFDEAGEVETGADEASDEAMESEAAEEDTFDEAGEVETGADEASDEAMESEAAEEDTFDEAGEVENGADEASDEAMESEAAEEDTFDEAGEGETGADETSDEAMESEAAEEDIFDEAGEGETGADETADEAGEGETAEDDIFTETVEGETGDNSGEAGLEDTAAEASAENIESADTAAEASAENIESADTAAEASAESAESANTAAEASAEDTENADTAAEASAASDARASDDQDVAEIRNANDSAGAKESSRNEALAGDEADSDVSRDYMEGPLTFEGHDYTVIASFDKSAGIPAGSVLTVTEITQEDAAYQEYREQAEKAVTETGAGESSSDKKDTKKEAAGKASENETGQKVAWVRLFDISIMKDGKVIEPTGPVSVQINYHEAMERAKNADVKAVHFEGEEETPRVLGTEAEGTETSVEQVTFDTDSFSVFAIVGTTIEKTVLASDGNNYRVSASYDADTGIPEEAELEVREILQRADSEESDSAGDEYSEYVEKTENALGLEKGSAAYIRLFDIKIVDKNDHGVKYQPAEGTTVDVKIELADAQSAGLSVVHFADKEDAGEVVENASILGASGEGRIVEFPADGFSVYVVVDHENGTVVTPRVEFHFIDRYTDEQYAAGITPGTAASPFNFVNTDGTYQTTQILTDGEALELIANPSNIQIDNGDGTAIEKFFYGWYLVEQSTDTTALDPSTGKYTGSIVYTWPANPDQIQLEKEISIEADGDDLTWTMDGVTGTGTMDSEGTVHVYLAPLYEDFYFINFHKGPKEDTSGIADSLMARRLVVFGSADSASVRIGDVICDSPDPTHKIFSGWETITENNETDTYYQTVHHVTDGTGSLQNEEVANPEGADGYYITVSKTDSDVTVLDLYPVFDEARWIHFNTGQTGNGASYVGAAYRLTNDFRQSDDNSGYYYFDNAFFTGDSSTQGHMSTRPGYELKGWYLFANLDANGNITNMDTAEDVTIKYLDDSGTQQTATITTTAIQAVNGQGTIQNIGTWYVDSDGRISQNEGGSKMFEVDSNGRLRFYKALNDMTLYANWEVQRASYRVIIWKQRVEDDVNAEDRDKTYDYEIFYTSIPVDTDTLPDLTDFTGTYVDSDNNTITVSGLDLQDIDYTGFHYSRSDIDKKGNPNPDGTTVYNVYYDRDINTLHFQVQGGATYSWTETTGDEEPQYGLVNGAYVLLTRGEDGVYHTYTFEPAYNASDEEQNVMYGIVNGQYVELDATANVENNFSYKRFDETTSNTGTQYALVNGEYIQLTYEILDSTTQYTYGNYEYRPTDTYNNGNYYILSGDALVTSYLYYNNNNGRWYKTRTGFWNYQYSNEYTGPVYRRYDNDLSGHEYTGQRYVVSGDVFVETDAESGTLYGKVGTYYYPLNVNTSNVYGWMLDGSEFTGTRYIQTDTDVDYSGIRYIRSGSDGAYTYSQTDGESDGLYGTDGRGGHVPLTMTSTVTGYTYVYAGEDYTGTRYTRNDTSTEYSGTRYSDAAGTVIVTEDGTGQFGRDANGVIRDLDYASGPVYIWTYTDSNGTTHTYTGKRYTKTQGGNSNNWHDIYTIIALYGQNIADNFPIKGWNGTTYNNGERWDPQSNSIGWSEVMVIVATMPDASVTFRLDTANRPLKTMNYYVEVLPGENGSVTHNNISYKLYNRIDARYNGVTSEDFLEIDGFTKNGWTDGNGNSNAYSTTYYIYSTTQNQTINFYYRRNQYDLTFDVNYPVDGSITYSNGQSSNLTVSGIYYGESLADYGSSTADGVTNWYYGIQDAENTAENELSGPDHYIFEGWYEDASCTVPFNFNSTMPVGNKIVYAKWTPEVFLVKIDPNGGEIDHINHNGYGSFGDNFAAIDVNYEKYPLPGVSNYNRNQSTYIRTEYNEVVSEYSIPRRFVAMSDRVASEYEDEGGTVYYYMNYQWRSTDGASGIYSDVRSAMYLTEEELEDYYELYKEIVIYSLDLALEANAGMRLLDYDTWKSLYVSSEKYRPLNSNESWTFLGWYKDDDTMPYNFSDPVTGPFTLTAHWRLDGGYAIQYVPQYIMPDGAEINGTVPAWRDPEDINTTYADGAQTEIYKQPTDLTKDGDPVDDDSVIFRGWALVSKTGTEENPVYTPLEVDEDGIITTYYNPSDAYTVNAANAGTDSTIYFRAVYQYKEASDRRPEITNLILDANTGYVNTSNSSDLPEWDCYPGVSAVNTENHLDSSNNPTQIEFGDIQSSAAVHLYKYATDAGVIAEDGQNFFTHPNGYFLLGFDDEPTEGDCIATYPADSVIAVTRDDNQTIYAVWEPMVYATFENETNGTVTFGLNSQDSTALSVINIKDGLYERQALTDYGNITLQAGESITLAFPNGAEKGITVSGTNTLGTGKVLEWNTSLDLVVNGTTTRYDTADEENPAYSYTHTTDTEHSHDLAHGDKNNTQDFSFNETLIVNENPLVVTFTERDNAYALVLEDNYPSAVGSTGNTQEIDYTRDQVLTASEPAGAKTQELPSANTCLGYKFLGWAYTADATEAVYKAGNWTIEELEDFFEVNDDTRTYTTVTEGGTVVRTLYAVWEINSESYKVYVYKDVPSPGNQSQSFTFDVLLSANYRVNSRNYAVLDSGSFTLKHNQYAVLNTSQNTAVSPVNITTTVTIYNVADDSRVNTALGDDPDYTFTASNSTAYTGGAFSDIDISVTEQSAQYYDTTMKRLAQTNDGTLVLEETQVSTDPLTVDGNKISWNRVEQGGTVIYTNQRQTFDITVAKNLVSNTSAAAAFNYSASYTDSYTDSGNTVTTTTSLDDFTVTSGSSKVLEDIPAGTTLTITETADANNNYIVSAASAEGATDTDSSANGFAFNVTKDDTITYTNTLKSYPVKFRLVDQDGNTTINAMFSLASSAGSLGTDLYADASSTTNPGVFYNSSQFWADTYTLNQTTIPSGYIGLTDDVTLTVTGEGITSDNEFVTVTGDAQNGYVVTVKNWAEKDVSIKKILADPLLTSTREFGFSYSYTSPVSGETVTGTFTLSPTSNDPNGAVRTLKIPVNATDFRVTELTSGSYLTVPDRYTTAAAGIKGTNTAITDTDDSDYVFAFSPVTEAAAVTFTNATKTKNVTVKKVVSDETDQTEFDFTMTLLNGAYAIGGYTVYTAADEQDSLTTSPNGTVPFRLKHNEEKVFTIPAGAKLVVAETVPAGYIATASLVDSDDTAVTDGDTAAESFTVTSVTKDGTITFLNSKGVPVRIIKIDQADNALANAVFSISGDNITDETGLTSTIPSGGTDAVIYTNDALPVGSYTLTETAAPDGYNSLGAPVIITVAGTASGITVSASIDGTEIAYPYVKQDIETGIWTIKITNTTGYELPSTGGPGTVIYRIAGLLLIILAGIVYSLSRNTRDFSRGICAKKRLGSLRAESCDEE